MASMDKAIPGTVAWVELHAPDLDAARKFYGSLLGWSYVGGDDPKTHFYTMGQLGGRNVAGMAKLGSPPAFPPTWGIYLATDDADDIARKVAEAGGKVLIPPMNVMDQGRMAQFTDPTGAHFGVWQGNKHHGAQVVDEPGAMTWHEVYSRDAAKARAFYARVFGLEAKQLDAPGIDYWTLHKGPKTAFGVMQITDQMPKDEPSHWNAYFAVTDVDASMKEAVALGGKVLAPPFDTPYGRMAVVADPFGAAFCLLTPSQQP